MIALLSGLVAVRRPDHVVIDCQGVGYRAAVSAETLRQVPAAGQPVMLHTHLIMRDDAISLYGFAAEEERDLFLMLLGVQSVGPKVALEVLSGGPTRDLLRALAAGDAARFQAVKGVGKRTAERIIVELREKVGASDLGDGSDAIHIRRSDDPRVIAREGLTGLGYSLDEAEALLIDLDGGTPEELIAAALRGARR
jgi:Holliday junction DNA helicase RuvA